MNNRKRKSFKIETLHQGDNQFSTMVWLMDSLDIPYWERVPQYKIPYSLTGKMRCCVKSKGRGRPHIFQKYVAPHLERVNECLYMT